MLSGMDDQENRAGDKQPWATPAADRQYSDGGLSMSTRHGQVEDLVMDEPIERHGINADHPVRSLDDALASGLEDCARCGGTHPEPLPWKKFAIPVQIGWGSFVYWATCPASGDPIMLYVGPANVEMTIDNQPAAAAAGGWTAPVCDECGAPVDRHETSCSHYAEPIPDEGQD